MPKEVSRLCVTPVKGMRLLHPEAATLDQSGVGENRRFYLIDADGALFSGSDLGSLVAIVPDWDPESGRLSLAFPDGQECSGVATALGESVETGFYGTRTVSGRVVEGPWAAALSAYAGTPLRLVRGSGEAYDAFPLSLVSQESVRDLAGRGGRQDDIDSRRFRINIEMTGCEPYEEESWGENLVRFGEATVRVFGQIPRCVVTTENPDTGLKDFDTLKVIASYRRLMGDGRGLPFGVYGRVEEPGTVRVGDLVEPLV